VVIVKDGDNKMLKYITPEGNYVEETWEQYALRNLSDLKLAREENRRLRDALMSIREKGIDIDCPKCGADIGWSLPDRYFEVLG
jgi:hypothetical protein